MLLRPPEPEKRVQSTVARFRSKATVAASTSARSSAGLTRRRAPKPRSVTSDEASSVASKNRASVCRVRQSTIARPRASAAVHLELGTVLLYARDAQRV